MHSKLFITRVAQQVLHPMVRLNPYRDPWLLDGRVIPIYEACQKEETGLGCTIYDPQSGCNFISVVCVGVHTYT